MRKLATYLTLATAAAATAVAVSSPASAQGFKIDQKKLDRATFYSSPRQFQILDERPIIKDFREAPSAPQQIELPPGPQGFGSGGGGGGAGALPGGGPGGGGGSAPMQLGGPVIQPRTSNPMMPNAAGALPKSGFGPSNIPARGMGPRGALPDATSTNRLMGRMMTPVKKQGLAVGAPRGLTPTRGPSNGNYSGPPVASYSGGYGTGSGSGYGGSASSTTTSVRGSLLKKN